MVECCLICSSVLAIPELGLFDVAASLAVRGDTGNIGLAELEVKIAFLFRRQLPKV